MPKITGIISHQVNTIIPKERAREIELQNSEIGLHLCFVKIMTSMYNWKTTIS